MTEQRQPSTPDEANCCVCGNTPGTYRNYQDQLLCAHCANCGCGTVPCSRAAAATNPPGSPREQLPTDVLTLLSRRSYLSTACETARLVDGAIIRNPDRADLVVHRDRLHQRCRLNQKFTGETCSCPCHPQPTD